MQTGDIRQIAVNVNPKYSVFVGENLKDEIIEFIRDKRVFVITDSNLFSFYRDFLNELSQHLFVFEAGEESKNINTLMKIYDFLLDKSADRHSLILAFGGGVVGDIVGFAAATYMRGAKLVQLPTSLLAMVDSSIGGKTGINYGGYKNIVGSFYQPEAVFVDVGFLKTLPEREYLSAFAEVVKYGMIRDKKLFEFLENSVDALKNRDLDSLQFVVERSIKNKVEIVVEDEKEKNIRALLNFGHTFAHAIESITNYKRYLHGEAVSIGMVMASRLAEKLGYMSRDESDRLKSLLSSLGLPVQVDFHIKPEQVYEIMLKDKKNRDGVLRFVLTVGIGNSIITDGIARKVVEEVIGANE
ncbi:3-dehydroquinate synthase [Hippea alviniae]|uniref:3-dehydroquinate synthase n=1 Tax=Hippea alviniae TaxID=1279027 RepID=UPI0003B396E6|nr:3-dehydroquinate synthase [Hippea alviniae]